MKTSMAVDRWRSMVGFGAARIQDTLSLQDLPLDDGAQAIRRYWDVEKGSEHTPLLSGLALF